MTNYDSGDVILVTFQFTGGEGSKKRPALVLSTPEYHGERQEIIMAAITSNISRLLIGDCMLTDWKKAGLLYPSVVTAILRTVRQDMVKCILGTLTDSDFRSVSSKLKQVIAIQ